MIERHLQANLHEPVLIAAFRGWNDAGDAASFAAAHLARVWGAKRIASVDPEDFYDFQAVRPQVRLVDGKTRQITWPQNEFWAAEDTGGPDVLLLQGTEPNMRWKTFSRLIIEVAREHGVKLAITFGALLADVAHSRPVHITGTAADPRLIDRLNLQRSRYEGPTGIVGVLHDSFSAEGIDSASLWAAVPHYLAVNPNPKAALALVRKATELLSVAADTSELEDASRAYEKQVSEVVADDEDVQAYVRLLEERSDAGGLEEVDESKLPSGEALAAELEDFLRDREGPEQQS